VGLAAGLTTWTAVADPQWDLPPAVPEGFLPKLGAVTADGDLGEWSAAAAVPLRFASYIAHRKPSHTWNGPMDCGMEVFCGWNEEGLCLAGFVADDDVQNDAAPENSFQRDCLELYVDGRIGAALMKPPYTKGAYQLYVRPPVGGKTSELFIHPAHGAIAGARVAGKLVAGGWTFEVVLPWSAFPGFTPRAGSNLGLQFGLDDYDGRDSGLIQPLMMSWQAATMLFMSPQKMVKWTLADRFPKGAGTLVGTVAGIDMPSEIYEGNSVKAAIELGRSMAGSAASCRYEVRDWMGVVVAQGPVSLAKRTPPWQDSAGGGFEWVLGNARDGVYTVDATFADAQGAALGVSRRSVMLMRFVRQEGNAAVTAAVTRIEKADIARLAQTEPFRAAAWLGAAACVEKLKWAIELRDRQLLQVTKRELLTRLAVLETGAVPADCPPLYALLALTAKPEAQVVVEYPATRAMPTQTTASVTFYWAGLPLASASIMEFADTEAARRDFDQPSSGWWQKMRREDMRLAGLPAHSSQMPFEMIPFDLAKFDPARQALVCSFAKNIIVAVDADALDGIQAEAVTLNDSAQKPAREAVQRWARKAGKPVVDFQTAVTNGWCLIAGLPSDEKDAQALRKIKQIFKAVPADEMRWVSVLDGSRTLFLGPAPREVAETATRLITAGKPVTAADADALRQALLRSVPKPRMTPTPVKDMSLYSGDLHTHSGYSDGSSTPVGMALEAMYCGMDFMALTDHNTVDGAQVANKLFRDCGIDFPVIIGEEITMSWSHMNAYPLREVIPANLSPYATIKTAHRQGAVIQWNHPGSYDMAWYLAHGEQAMSGTGLDAWEHPMPQYSQWKKAGQLPPLVGSSDTHDATYGSSERTLILAPGPAADDVAEAVRRGANLLVSCADARFFLGPDEMIARAVTAMADGQAMQEQRATRLKAALAKADIPSLLRKSPSAVVKPSDVAQ
jgi:hypothetical protein